MYYGIYHPVLISLMLLPEVEVKAKFEVLMAGESGL
jgi:hypothetical protein